MALIPLNITKLFRRKILNILVITNHLIYLRESNT